MGYGARELIGLGRNPIAGAGPERDAVLAKVRAGQRADALID